MTFSADGTKVLAEINRLNKVLRTYGTSIDKLERSNNRVARSNKALQENNKLLANSFFSLGNAVKAFATFNISRFLTDIVAETGRAIQAQQQYTLSFGETLGSLERGRQLYTELNELAIRLPGSARELAESYRSLDLRGLNPSLQSIENLLDLSSGLGKPVSQLVEAIADASVFQFDRLAELGIIARQSTDSVVFTFRGVREEVDKNSASISAYFDRLSDGFDGRAELGAETIGASFERLTDTLVAAIARLDDATGTSEVFGAFFRDLSIGIGNLAGIDTRRQELERLNSELERLENIPATSLSRTLFNNGYEAQVRSVKNAVEELSQEIKFFADESLLFSQTVVPNQTDGLENLEEQFIKTTQTIASRTRTLDNQQDNLISRARELLATQGDINPKLRESLENSLRELEVAKQTVQQRKLEAEQVRALKNEFNQINRVSLDNVDRIVSDFNRQVEVINAAAAGQITGIAAASVNAAELQAKAFQNLQKQIQQLLGKEIIDDGTELAAQSIRRRDDLLAGLIAEGGKTQEAAEIAKQQGLLELRARLDKQLAQGFGNNEAFNSAEQRFLSDRELFIRNVERVGGNLELALERYNRAFGDDLVESIGSSINSTDNFAEATIKLNQELVSLSESTGVSLALLREFAQGDFVDALNRAFDVNVGSNVSNLDELAVQRAALEGLRDAEIGNRQAINDRLSQLDRERLEAIREFRQQELTLAQVASLSLRELDQLTGVQRVEIAGQTFGLLSQIYQQAQTNGELSFVAERNIRATQVAIDSLAAGWKMLQQGGIFAKPLAIATWALGALTARTILRSQPGDVPSSDGGGIGGQGTNTNPNSSAVPQAPQAAQTGGTIIYYSGVGETDAQARRNIGRALEDLSLNDEIDFDGSDFRVVRGAA